LKAIALFLVVRAVFVSLTHIAPSPIDPQKPCPSAAKMPKRAMRKRIDKRVEARRRGPVLVPPTTPEPEPLKLHAAGDPPPLAATDRNG
jgi:hypothetical protein